MSNVLPPENVPPRDAPSRTRGRLRYLWLIGAFVYAAVIWYLGWEKFRNALESIDARFLAGLTLAAVAAVWLRVMKWRFILGPGLGVAPLFFLSKAAGDLTPSRVGELSPLLLRQYRTPRIAAWIVVDRLLEAGATLALGVYGAAGLSTPTRGLLPLMGVAACGLVILPALLITRRGLFVWIERRTVRWRALHRTARFLAASSGEVVQLKSKLWIAAALTGLCTVLDLVTGLLAYKSLGYDLPFALIGVVQCAHGVITAVPFLPNATGVPYVLVGMLVNQSAGVPYAVIAASVTVNVLLTNTVFWLSFGIGMWTRRKS